MSWFHFNKQERLRRNREIRRETAEDARKEAAENPWMIGRQVTDVLKRACDEERTFEEYLGEPMPQHLHAALQLEIALWRRILLALEKADTKNMDEHKYTALHDNIRALLLCLINLLHAEEEMLTSCLVRHYTQIIQTIQAEAARVTP
ncbi:MAG: hypothetical protein ACSLFQ_13230 [Thermoanaerobaculia bacterium]